MVPHLPLLMVLLSLPPNSFARPDSTLAGLRHGYEQQTPTDGNTISSLIQRRGLPVSDHVSDDNPNQHHQLSPNLVDDGQRHHPHHRYHEPGTKIGRDARAESKSPSETASSRRPSVPFAIDISTFRTSMTNWDPVPIDKSVGTNEIFDPPFLGAGTGDVGNGYNTSSSYDWPAVAMIHLDGCAIFEASELKKADATPQQPQNSVFVINLGDQDLMARFKPGSDDTTAEKDQEVALDLENSQVFAVPNKAYLIENVGCDQARFMMFSPTQVSTNTTRSDSIQRAREGGDISICKEISPKMKECLQKCGFVGPGGESASATAKIEAAATTIPTRLAGRGVDPSLPFEGLGEGGDSEPPVQYYPTSITDLSLPGGPDAPKSGAKVEPYTTAIAITHPTHPTPPAISTRNDALDSLATNQTVTDFNPNPPLKTESDNKPTNTQLSRAAEETAPPVGYPVQPMPYVLNVGLGRNYRVLRPMPLPPVPTQLTGDTPEEGGWTGGNQNLDPTSVVDGNVRGGNGTRSDSGVVSDSSSVADGSAATAILPVPTNSNVATDGTASALRRLDF